MIRYFKLITGEEVICEYDALWSMGSSNDVILVKNPRVVALMPAPNGGTNVTMIPLMWSARSSALVKIYLSHILAECDVPEEKFEKMYLQSTSSLDLTSRIKA